MSAVVIPFPCHRRDRARPSHTPHADDWTRGLDSPEPSQAERIIGRARQIGFGWNLNNFDRESVVAAAKHWLNCGIPEQDVLKRADAMAKRLAASHNPDGPRAA